MRKLKLKINDKDYVLRMNRVSIKWLESKGFDIRSFEEKPVTFFDLLWGSLFVADYADEDANALLEVYEKEHDVLPVIKFAMEEYTAFITALSVTSSKTEEIEIIEE